MIRPGQTIKIRQTISDGHNGKLAVCKKYKILKVYSHHVLCVNPHGIRYCFSYGDLVINRCIKQSPKLEALKMTVEQ